MHTRNHSTFSGVWIVAVSVQRIVIFPTNRIRNRLAEPTSVRIGIGIVREFQNLRIWIGIVFVRREVFANYSQTPTLYCSLAFFLMISCSWLIYIYILENLTGKLNHGVIFLYIVYVFNIKIKYSWILWKILANINNKTEIIIFANMNNIHKIKLWRIGIGTYL